MLRAFISLVTHLFKQRWFQQLFYWVAILALASTLLMLVSFIISEPESLSEFILVLLLDIAFWGWIVFVMRRKLREPQ